MTAATYQALRRPVMLTAAMLCGVVAMVLILAAIGLATPSATCIAWVEYPAGHAPVEHNCPVPAHSYMAP